MSRISTCFVLVFVCLMSGGQADDRLNVLFILADDQRTDTISAYGNPHIETPNLDRLAAQGFNFRRNYVMGSIHGAVCVPSRAMIMSGRTLYRVPMNLEDTPILPELLRREGYTTFATGKWHNEGASFLRGFERGTAVFLGGMSNHEAVPLRDVSPEGKFVNKRTGDGFSSTLFADAAVEFLNGYEDDKPFFAYVSFTASHDPRMPPVEYRERYYANLPPLPPNFMPQHPFDNGWMVGRDENLGPWPRTERLVRNQLAEYYGLITHMDEQVGRILDALEQNGFADDTLVVYAADHGLAVGSHGLLGKQNLYEHSSGAPLILAGPGIPKGESTLALTYLHDVMPTLLDFLDVNAPEGVEGRNLLPIVNGQTKSVRDTLFTTYENSQRAIHDGRWKLIRYPLVDVTQLFDLEHDPHELNNLADDPQHQDRVERMTNLLREWQQKTSDDAPLVVDNPKPKIRDMTGTPREPDQWQPEWIVEKYFGDSR